jgi:hypothetical protein
MSKFGLEHPYLCDLKNNIDWPLIHVFGWVFAVMFLDGASWNARPDATSGLGRGGGVLYILTCMGWSLLECSIGSAIDKFAIEGSLC